MFGCEGSIVLCRPHLVLYRDVVVVVANSYADVVIVVAAFLFVVFSRFSTISSLFSCAPPFNKDCFIGGVDDGGGSGSGTYIQIHNVTSVHFVPSRSAHSVFIAPSPFSPPSALSIVPILSFYAAIQYIIVFFKCN